MKSLSIPRRHRAKVFVALLTCASQLAAPVSFAQTAVAASGSVDDELSEAERLIANVDYEGAIPVLERISNAKGLTHEQLIRVYRNLATAQAVMGHGAQARDAFIKLIAIDPDFRADQNMSPRVKAPYFEARGVWSAQSVKPGIEATATVHRGTDSRIVVTLRDPTHMAGHVVVGYHWEGSDPFTVKSSPASPTTTLVIPPPKDKSTYLEVYAQAVDGNDSVLWESGSQTKPVVFEVPAAAPALAANGGEGDKSSSIIASPIFWVVAGVLVAGGATAAYFLARPNNAATTQQLTPVASCAGSRCL